MQTIDSPDPAAVFGAALSLHSAGLASDVSNTGRNLSDCYGGGDEFLRQCLRVATVFEAWACRHVDWDQLDDVWPYLLESEFGRVVNEEISIYALDQFTEEHCPAVAAALKLALRGPDLRRELLAEQAALETRLRELHYERRSVRRQLKACAVLAEPPLQGIAPLGTSTYVPGRDDYERPMPA